jgi:hypothetical protein
MADKNFKVKKNIQVTDLAVAGPVTVDSSGVLASSSALPVNLGGTGQTSASAAFDALLPTQTNNANKLLGTNGTSASWVSPGIAYQTSAPDNPVTGQLWVDSDETGDSLDPYIIRRKTITATAGQTVFTTDVVFTDGYEQIYYNGVLLVRSTDYTTNGSTNTVTLLQGASLGDTVEIISSTPINLVNTLAGNSANTIIAQTASSIPLIVQGATSQTANLFEVKNSAGEIRHEFKANGQAYVRATGPDQAGFAIERYTDDLAVLQLRSFGGTISSPTVKTNGTRIGMITAEGYDGTSSPSSARIQFFVDGTVSTGNVPGAIGFNTTPVGGSHTERMRITSAGNVGIGTASPSSTLHVAGGTGSTIRNTASSGSSWFVGSNVDSMIIHNESNTPLVFTTNGSERMRITSAGNVGIGTSVPAVKLQIDGTFGFRDNSQSVPAQDNGTNPTLIMTNNFSGGAGETSLFNTCAGLTGGIRLSQVTGTGTYKDMAWFQRNLTYQYVPLYSLAPATDISFSSSWVAGTSTASYNYIINAANNTGGNGLVVFLNGSTRAEDNGANSLTIRNDVANMYLGRSGATTYIFGRTDVSDQDLKENIQTYSNATDIIKSLVPKQFNFIGSERKQYGFIAQDIENEEIVLPGGEGVPWSVDYNSIVSALVKANQELTERIEFLEATINE